MSSACARTWASSTWLFQTSGDGAASGTMPESSDGKASRSSAPAALEENGTTGTLRRCLVGCCEPPLGKHGCPETSLVKVATHGARQEVLAAAISVAIGQRYELLVLLGATCPGSSR